VDEQPVSGCDPLVLEHPEVDAATAPDDIHDDVRGYIQAVNWVTRLVAPEVTFGWQVNLWGVGAANWMYDSGDEPAVNAKATADYVTALGVFEGDLPPDFLAVDRYEADDFTARMFDAINGMMLDMLAAVARKDYEDRRRRQAQGQAKAKAAGRYKGRPENTARNAGIVSMLRAGASWSQIQAAIGCSRATIAKIAKRLDTKEQVAG